MKWERCDSTPGQPHKYRREDGWSIYYADEKLVRWSLCQPDGKELPGPSGWKLDSIDLVLKWADEVIAKFGGNFQAP